MYMVLVEIYLFFFLLCAPGCILKIKKNYEWNELKKSHFSSGGDSGGAFAWTSSLAHQELTAVF